VWVVLEAWEWGGMGHSKTILIGVYFNTFKFLLAWLWLRFWTFIWRAEAVLRGFAASGMYNMQVEQVEQLILAGAT